MVKITEKNISQVIGREIISPILIAEIDYLGIDQDEFVDYYSGVFEKLSDDVYDFRRQQISFLTEKLGKDIISFEKLEDYYKNGNNPEYINNHKKSLSSKDEIRFESIKPNRKRAVAKFDILSGRKQSTYRVKRIKSGAFIQNVEATDFRSLPRYFDEIEDEFIKHEFFQKFLHSVFTLVNDLHDKMIKKLSVTAHFMGIKAYDDMKPTNSPEGPHEDGADYIVSALVVNRNNVESGKSQIIEKHLDGSMEVVWEHTLVPGQFIFQSDTGDELVYGNDLWHHVTPIEVINKDLPGTREIIGLDINVIDKY